MAAKSKAAAKKAPKKSKAAPKSNPNDNYGAFVRNMGRFIKDLTSALS